MFVALPEKTNWTTGEKSAFDGMPIAFQYDPRALVRRLSPIQLPRDASGRSVPDLLIYAMGILGLVFAVMYGVALVLGLVLARSITRGVHALSVGTQRLRQGDFDHQIRVRSSDQLGELAESFNLMSRGIQQLMLEQGEKERLEEELRIARQIQMSLLPAQGTAELARRARRGAVPARRPRWAGTTTTSCRSARRGWACSWPTSRARAPRPPCTWRSSRGWCSRSRGSTSPRRRC